MGDTSGSGCVAVWDVRGMCNLQLESTGNFIVHVF